MFSRSVALVTPGQSTILLISTLVFATIPVWKYLTAASAVASLLMVIRPAAFVIVENHGLQRILDEDLSDIPELAEAAPARTTPTAGATAASPTW